MLYPDLRGTGRGSTANEAVEAAIPPNTSLYGIAFLPIR
jgi:hypothetical protein